MMQRIHDKAKGLFANIIFALVIVTFVLWGAQSYVASKGRDPVLMSVNDQVISAKAFQSRFRAAMNGYLQRYGETQVAQFRHQIKQSLIQKMMQDLLRNEASVELGFKITETQLKQAITQLPAFQVKGQFSEQRLAQFFQHYPHQSEVFWKNLENDLVQKQFSSAFILGAFALEKEIDNTEALMREERDVRYQIFRPKQFSVPTPSDQARQSFYDKHKARFAIPEKVKLAYLELNPKVINVDPMPGPNPTDTQQQRIQRKFSAMAEQLASITFSDPDTLETAAAKLKLKIKYTPFFNRSHGQDLLSKQARVRKVAFS